MKATESKQKIIGWLKQNGYRCIEPNSYANDTWNIMLDDNQIAIANGYGDADYLEGYSLYALIGYFSYHGFEYASQQITPSHERFNEACKLYYNINGNTSVFDCLRVAAGLLPTDN